MAAIIIIIIRRFAPLLLASSAGAIELSEGGMSTWAQERGDDWKDAEVDEYGGARAYNPDWAEKQPGTFGVDFGKGVNGSDDDNGNSDDENSENEEDSD